MRNLKNYITIVVAALAFTACKKDWLDVNDNPNASTEADPALLFAGAATDYSANRTSEIGLASAMWGQTWSSGQFVGVFADPERYQISTFTTGNTWRSHYTGVQKNLTLAIQIAQEADIPNPNAIAQCKVLSALTYYTTSIFWEKVPFTQAINPDFENPIFDDQQTVMNGVVAMIDEALGMFDPANPNKIDDFYYNGDIDAWIAFAKSVKFRTLMLMAKNDPSKVGEIQSMLAAGGMLTQDANFPFFAASGTQNPVWNVLNSFAGGANLFYFASDAMVTLMKQYNDPRLNTYFVEGPSAPGDIIGVKPGESQTPDNALVNIDLLKPDSPERVFTASEQLFLEAEAEARYGSMVNAQTKLNQAVAAGMAQYGVDGTAFIAGLTPLATLSQEGAIQQIAELSWIDLFEKPVEAWVNVRRTGYPVLETPQGAPVAGFIQRLPYSPDERSTNDNIPVDPLLDTKMWFNQ